jgi:hypothetical protein
MVHGQTIEPVSSPVPNLRTRDLVRSIVRAEVHPPFVSSPMSHLTTRPRAGEASTPATGRLSLPLPHPLLYGRLAMYPPHIATSDLESRWTSYGVVRRWQSGYQPMKQGLATTLYQAVGGSAAGVFTAVATNPLDVVRARLQVSMRQDQGM